LIRYAMFPPRWGLEKEKDGVQLVSSQAPSLPSETITTLTDTRYLEALPIYLSSHSAASIGKALRLIVGVL
jgi:hypothetical protein